MKVKIEVSKMISFKRRRCADRFLNAHTVSSSSRRDRVVPIATFITTSRYHMTFARTDHLITCLGQPGHTMVRRAPPESRVVRSWPHFWPEDAAIDPSPRNRSHYNSDRCRPAAPAHHRCTHISRRKDGDAVTEKASGFRVTFIFACVFPSCVKYDGNDKTVFSEKTSYAKTRGLGGSACA